MLAASVVIPGIGMLPGPAAGWLGLEAVEKASITSKSVTRLFGNLRMRAHVKRIRSMRRTNTIGILAFACALHAQDSTFSANVNVVNLLATVRDRDGRFVKDLTKEDFAVQEDGRPQTIRYFAQESNLPLAIGLLVDTSCSQIRVLESERTASYKFLDQVLRAEDLAFVLRFDYKVNLLQGFTSSREELATAFNNLDRPKHCNTLLYDAIHDASEQLMRKQAGRKAFVVLSDGGDVRSKYSIGTAIEFAQRADTIIYSVLFANRQGIGPPASMAAQAIYLARGRRVMRRLAQETGGGYFAVSKEKPIEKIYAEIEEELRNQYSIGYTPDRIDGNKTFRKIALMPKNKDLIVQTRAGYYPK
jgi:VWFA-related protein